MAIAVIGGVISSTFLTLLVVPVVYLFVEATRQFARRMFTKLLGLERSSERVVPSEGSANDNDDDDTDRAAAAE
jgi:hypothetical protein